MGGYSKDDAVETNDIRFVLDACLILTDAHKSYSTIHNMVYAYYAYMVG